MATVFNHDFKNKTFEKKFNEIYFSSLEKTRKDEKYEILQRKLDFYRKMFRNHFGISPEMIESFISTVEEGIELEYESAIHELINYIDGNEK